MLRMLWGPLVLQTAWQLCWNRLGMCKSKAVVTEMRMMMTARMTHQWTLLLGCSSVIAQIVQRASRPMEHVRWVLRMHTCCGNVFGGLWTAINQVMPILVPEEPYALAHIQAKHFMSIVRGRWSWISSVSTGCPCSHVCMYVNCHSFPCRYVVDVLIRMSTSFPPRQQQGMHNQALLHLSGMSAWSNILRGPFGRTLSGQIESGQ